jgi:Ca2+-binding RTX toxin-like protein
MPRAFLASRAEGIEMATIVGTSGDDSLQGESSRPNFIDGLDGDDVIAAGWAHDTLLGGNGDDLLTGGWFEHLRINGGVGADTLVSYMQSSVYGNRFCLLNGGAGDDLILGGAEDTLVGAEGNDTIEASGEAARLIAGSGDDVIHVDLYLARTGGATTIDGGEGLDRLVAEGGDLGFALISGVEIYEAIRVSGTAEQIEAFDSIVLMEGADVDRISIGASGRLDLRHELGGLAVHYVSAGESDSFVSGSGNDLLESEYNAAKLNGGMGHDTLIGQGTLIGGLGNDSIDGSGLLDGGDGDDVIESAADRVKVSAGVGNDFVTTSGRKVTIDAGIGDDTVSLAGGYSSARVIDGGDGYDVLRDIGDLTSVDYRGFERLETLGMLKLTAAQIEAFDMIAGARSGSAARVIMTDSSSLELSDKLQGGRIVISGSSGDDVISTDIGDDVLRGGAGDDLLNAMAGNDRLVFKGGADTLNGGAGADVFEANGKVRGVMDGGSGYDTLVISGITATVIDIKLATIVDIEVLDVRDETAFGTADQFESFDMIIATDDIGVARINLRLVEAGDLELYRQLGGRDTEVHGSNGDDLIHLSGGDDLISGERGDDSLDGGRGNDELLGEDGSDILIGGSGNDLLWGGSGENVFRGGVGRDRFVFNDSAYNKELETVADFNSSDDTIYLSRDAFGGFPPGRLEKRYFKDLGEGDRDGDDWFIYDPESGTLYFADVFEHGSDGMSAFAILMGAPDLSWKDIVVG